MLCPNCHAENGSDSKFCEHCGANIAEIRTRLEEEGYTASSSKDDLVETNNPADQEPFCPKCDKQIPQNSKFCEHCGASQELSTTRPVITAVTQQGKGKLENWLTQKNLIGLAAVLIATALFYYFLVRPIQEKRAYEDCFGALTETGQLPRGLQTSEKNFRIDACVKSRGASEIRNKYEREQEQRATEQAAREAEARRIQGLKSLTSDEKNRVKLDVDSIVRSNWNESIKTVTGTISNTNFFDVENIKLKIETTSEKNGVNKIDEQECELNNFIVYQNSNKKFEKDCSFSNGWHTINIVKVEKLIK